jgi:hypothetical protein
LTISLGSTPFTDVAADGDAALVIAPADLRRDDLRLERRELLERHADALGRVRHVEAVQVVQLAALEGRSRSAIRSACRARGAG